MTPDEIGFLESIADNPLDEIARQVYADWLQDRDDPQATFTRSSAEFLRALRDLANHRSHLEVSWVSKIDPVFARVGVFCLSLMEAGKMTVTSAVKPGSTVSVGQTVFEIETEKATIPIDSEQNALVLSVLVQLGQSV